MRLHY